MISIADLCRAVRAPEGVRRLDSPTGQRAGVAALAREGEGGVELLFIHRAEHPRDPWSGHMAFPGGRMEAGDEDGRAAAERETSEELGLELPACSRYLGRLSDVTAVAKGRRLGLVIEPHLYQALELPPLEPNHEVQAAVWIPLGFFTRREHRSTLDYRFGGVTVRLPCCRWEGRTVWGLTLRMVDELVERVTGIRFADTVPPRPSR